MGVIFIFIKLYTYIISIKYIFVDYILDGDNVSVKFDKYEYDTQIFEEYEAEKEAGTLSIRPIEELWKELKINDPD